MESLETRQVRPASVRGPFRRDVTMATTQSGAIQRPLLGEILVKTGMISIEDLEAALEEQKASEGTQRLGEILVRRGRIGFFSLGWALSRQTPAAGH